MNYSWANKKQINIAHYHTIVQLHEHIVNVCLQLLWFFVENSVMYCYIWWITVPYRHGFLAKCSVAPILQPCYKRWLSKNNLFENESSCDESWPCLDCSGCGSLVPIVRYVQRTMDEVPQQDGFWQAGDTEAITHWGRDKMDPISQTTFSSAFS